MRNTQGQAHILASTDHPQISFLLRFVKNPRNAIHVQAEPLHSKCELQNEAEDRGPRPS